MTGKTAVVVEVVDTALRAATEPGRDDREDRRILDAHPIEYRPLRSPVAMTGKTPVCDPRGPLVPVAATEPGRDDREDRLAEIVSSDLHSCSVWRAVVLSVPLLSTMAAGFVIVFGPDLGASASAWEGGYWSTRIRRSSCRWWEGGAACR